jgi:diadenosine tetraphosphate (Ap4A) HIT family hydrolase
MDNCQLCGPYIGNSTFIKGFDYWTLLVNYMQPTLGSTLVVLNRHVTSLSDLKANEAIDYWKIASDLERALQLSFQPQRINHLMLANAVRHVHYHVVPRYQEPVEFMGMNFVDEKFGHTPILTTTRKEQSILDGVKTQILQNL